jgi:hypothetical protein
MRTRRWARTQRRVDAMKLGSIPMSRRRVMELVASLVWSELIMVCPVRAALIRHLHSEESS